MRVKHTLVLLLILFYSSTQLFADHDLDIYEFNDLFVFDTLGESKTREFNFVSLIDDDELKIVGKISTLADHDVDAYYHYNDYLVVLIGNRVEIFDLSVPSKPVRVELHELREHDPLADYPRIVGCCSDIKHGPKLLVLSNKYTARVFFDPVRVVNAIRTGRFNNRYMKDIVEVDRDIPPYYEPRNKPFAVKTTDKYRYELTIDPDEIERSCLSRRKKVLRKVKIESGSEISSLVLGKLKGKFCNASVTEKGSQSEIVEDYWSLLHLLDLSDENSIAIAKDAFVEIFSDSRDVADDGFRNFMYFHKMVIMRIDNAIYDDFKLQDFLYEIDGSSENCLDKPLGGIEECIQKAGIIISEHGKEVDRLKELKRIGVRFVQCEGMMNPFEDFSFYNREVLKGFDLEINDYVNFIAEEYKKIIFCDEAIRIPWDDLRKRIIRWETFAKNHPDLSETNNHIKETLQKLVHLYIFGGANTPAYNYSEPCREIIPDAKKSYEIFLIENKNSNFYGLVEHVYEISKKNDFCLSGELKEFYEKYEYP